MSRIFRQKEWRFPLLEIDFILLEQKYERVKKGGAAIFKNQTLFSLMLTVLSFGLGTFLILRSPIIRSFRLIILVILAIVLLWLIRGIYQTITPMYSKKIRLLNYLYSPYFWAWRRDHLSEFSDNQIAGAICIACGIESGGLLAEAVKLEDFLLILCKQTRPQFEYDKYPDVLEKSKEIANKLKWLG